MKKRADLGLKKLFWRNSCTLLKIAKNLCAQCENERTCWSGDENFCYVQTRALCWKSLKSGVPSAKMTKRPDLGLKTLFWKSSRCLLKIAKKWWAQCENPKTCWPRAENLCFVQTRAFCWKSLKSGVPSAKMRKRADLRLKTSFLHKLVLFPENG